MLPLSKKVERITAFVNLWWLKWQEAAFIMFTPRHKWRVDRRNVREGDVVLLLGEGKLAGKSYRLARVVAVKPDEDNVVRTATISLRDRRRRGQAVTTREIAMAVQRLAVLLPVEEQWQGELVGPQPL